MALFQSIQAAARAPIPSAERAVEMIPIVATWVVPVGLVLNDIVEMGPLQAGYVPIDLLAALPDMDSNGTPTVKLDAGILSGNWLDSNSPVRTIGSEFFAADVTAQTGGIARMNKAAGAQLAPTNNDRSWGFKVNTAAATLTPGTIVTATLIVRPKIEGV
jgi:hypothetical protein